METSNFYKNGVSVKSILTFLLFSIALMSNTFAVEPAFPGDFSGTYTFNSDDCFDNYSDMIMAFPLRYGVVDGTDFKIEINEDRSKVIVSGFTLQEHDFRPDHPVEFRLDLPSNDQYDYKTKWSEDGLLSKSKRNLTEDSLMRGEFLEGADSKTYKFEIQANGDLLHSYKEYDFRGINPIPVVYEYSCLFKCKEEDK